MSAYNTRVFIDRALLERRIDAAAGKALARLGAYCRRVAITSLGRPDKKKPPRPPGQPPRARHPEGLRLIQFGLEPPRRLIVGPVGLGTTSPPAPQLQEHGGTVQLYRSQGDRPRYSTVQHHGYILVTVTLPPRPFMQPALQKTIQKLRDLTDFLR